jgi:hypothetical protein
VFKIIKYSGVLAIGICFAGAIASAAAASGSIGHGGGRYLGAAIRSPGVFRSGRTFGFARNGGSAVRAFGSGPIYSTYESMATDDRLDEGANCWVERRVFEDFEFRRVRPVVVCN